MVTGLEPQGSAVRWRQLPDRQFFGTEGSKLERCAEVGQEPQGQASVAKKQHTAQLQSVEGKRLLFAKAWYGSGHDKQG